MVFHYGTGPIIQNIVLLFTIIIATKNCHHSVNTSSILPKPFGKVAKIIRYNHDRFKKSFESIPKKFSYLTYQRLLYHTNCSRIAKMVPSSPLLRQIIEIKQDRNVSFSTKKSYLALCDILLFCHFWYFFSYFRAISFLKKLSKRKILFYLIKTGMEF